MKTRSVAIMDCVVEIINDFHPYESTHVWAKNHIVDEAHDWIVARFINKMKMKRLKRLTPEVLRRRVINRINNPRKARWSDLTIAKDAIESFMDSDFRMVDIERRILNLLDKGSVFDVRNLKSEVTNFETKIGLYK